jgi:hypothetical protein
MADAEKAARQALDLVKAGNVEESCALLDSIRSTDPKPPLYWYALSQCHLRKGEFELACNYLFAFHANLHAQHRKLLGLDKGGRVDPDLMSRLNGPENILAERRDADAHRGRKDFEAASRSMSLVVDWRITQLELLGYRLFG